MTDDDAKIFERYGAEDQVFEYLLARLRVEAGKAAASLLSAATEHAENHGNGDRWTIAAVEASAALSDIATHGIRVQESEQPPAGVS